MSYATQLLPGLRALAADLTAAGLPTSLNRSTTRVPGAWLRPDTLDGAESLAGGGVARCSLLLIAPQQGDAEALADLAGLLDKALGVLTPDGEVDTSVVIGIQNNQLPAFRVPVDLDL